MATFPRVSRSLPAFPRQTRAPNSGARRGDGRLPERLASHNVTKLATLLSRRASSAARRVVCRAQRASAVEVAHPAQAASSDVCSAVDNRPGALPSLHRYRGLVLDSSYRPIEVVSWQRAISMDLHDKVRRG